MWRSSWLSHGSLNFLVEESLETENDHIQLDSTSTENFFGVIAAVYSLGQAISSPIFGFWSNRINQTKFPTIVGISLAVSFFVLFAFVCAFCIFSRSLEGLESVAINKRSLNCQHLVLFQFQLTVSLHFISSRAFLLDEVLKSEIKKYFSGFRQCSIHHASTWNSFSSLYDDDLTCGYGYWRRLVGPRLVSIRRI